LDIVAKTIAEHIYYGPLLVHDLPKSADQGWGGDGRVALLGDSAHGIRPSSGNSINLHIYKCMYINIHILMHVYKMYVSI
jgi:hypothetical protein